METEARRAWLEARRNGIGGSDAAAVLGLSPWKSAIELYAEKLGYGDPEFDEPEWMYWGRCLEPAIAARYAEETGRLLEEPVPYLLEWSPRYPFMCCTVDRNIIAADRKGWGVLEIKTAREFKERDWTGDEPPIEYQVQLQHNMVVTGREWGSFAVLIGGQQFFYCDVEKNERFCHYLVTKEAEFWDCVQRQVQPAPGDPAESARRALDRLYPTDTGETVELPPDLMDEVDKLMECKRDKKKAEAEIDFIENEIRAAMGAATIGVLPNGVTFKLGLVKRKGYEVKPVEFRQLRRIS